MTAQEQEQQERARRAAEAARLADEARQRAEADLRRHGQAVVGMGARP